MHLPELENANNARMQLQLEWIASSLFFLGGVSMCALPLPVLLPLSLCPSHSTYAYAYPLPLPLPLLCTWYFVEIIGNGKQVDKLQQKLVINKALWNHANSWKKAQNEKREAWEAGGGGGKSIEHLPMAWLFLNCTSNGAWQVAKTNSKVFTWISIFLRHIITWEIPADSSYLLAINQFTAIFLCFIFDLAIVLYTFTMRRKKYIH